MSVFLFLKEKGTKSDHILLQCCIYGVFIRLGGCVDVFMKDNDVQVGRNASF